MANAQNDEPVEAFRKATAAAMRAVAHQPELQLTFSPQPAGLSGGVARLPPPSADALRDDAAAIRGEADAISLRLRFHDSALQRELAPARAMARSVFDTLEQARCEARGVLRMPGIAGNLAAATEKRCRMRGAAEVAAPDALSVAEVTRLLAREVFTGQPLPESARRMVDPFRRWIESKAGDGLSRLGKLIHDQYAFAVLARRLAEDFEFAAAPAADDAAGNEQAASRRPDPQRRSEGEADATNKPTHRGEGALAGDPDAMAGFVPGIGDRVRARRRRRQQDDLRPGPAAPRYRVFTTDFDEVLEPASLCDSAELARLRLQLDAQLAPHLPAVARLANRLQRTVLARQKRAWKFDLEEGILDTARLTRVLTDPLHPLSHMARRDGAFLDTVVQLLIDNSGSMRGRPIALAAMSAEIIARTLERCGVKVEILGFTTRAWRGGRSRERWLAAGQPPAPGRLNDLRHIVYKSADVPWRRARRALGLMLRDGLLKENVDGEALVWAHSRLLGRAERRRILMVISDGGPLDDSTLAANPGNCLERHLHDVIEAIEQRSPVELVAIGIGHDVTRLYRRAVTIVDASQLGGAMLEELAELFREGAG